MRLDQICTHIVDCEHKSAPITPGGGFFAVGTPAMQGNVITYSEAREISAETFDLWTQRLKPEKGDLLFAREAPVGPVVIIPAALNVAPGQRTVLLRPDPRLVDSKFLYYKISSPRVQNSIMNFAMGSTVAHMNVVDVRSLDLQLPSLGEQRAIAEVLGALDDKIAVNRQLVESMERLLRAEYQKNIASNDAPKVPLSDVVELNPRRFIKNEVAPRIPMQSLPSPGMTVDHITFEKPNGGVRFMNGDTILARITPCLENGKTAYIACLRENEVGFGSTEYIIMRSRNGYPLVLTYFIATDARFRSAVIRRMVGSSGRQRVKASDIEDLPVFLNGDHDAMMIFGEQSEKRIILMQNLSAESRTLASLRDTLLPALMNGTLRVKDAEKQVGEVL